MARAALIAACIVAAAVVAYLLWPKGPPFRFLEGADHLPSAPYMAGDVTIPEAGAPDIYVIKANWTSFMDKARKELKEKGYAFEQGRGSSAAENFISESRHQVSFQNNQKAIYSRGENRNTSEPGWITVEIHERTWP